MAKSQVYGIMLIYADENELNQIHFLSSDNESDSNNVVESEVNFHCSTLQRHLIRLQHSHGLYRDIIDIMLGPRAVMFPV